MQSIYDMGYLLGFITLGHNELRDNIGEVLQKVKNYVKIEPILQPVTGEEQSIGGNVSVEARANISTRGSWYLVQNPFSDVRIFNLNVQRHKDETLKRCYELNELEKKRD